MKRIALLARTSTDRQKKEQTIKSQISEIKEWIKDNNCVITEYYCDDGWSGDLLARPELDRLRDDLAKDLWDAVVVVDRDRIARKYAYQELVIEEIKEANKEFICLHQATATTPEDKIMQGFQGLFAEYEKAKITERMRRGKLRKAREGKIVHGPAPYGYKYILKTKDKDGYLVIDEKEAEVVKKIFKWVVDEGLTVRKIIARLYKLGIPPRRRKRASWTHGPLCRILRNEVYIGTTYYNKQRAIVPRKPKNNEKYKKIKKSSREFRPKEEWIPIPVPAIVDEDLFRRAQEQLKRNQSVLNMRNRKNEYLLAGFVYCPCGWRRTGEGMKGKGRNLYYRCTGRIHDFPQPRKCKEGGVNAKVLDKIVWEQIRKLLAQPSLIKKQAKRWLDNRGKVKSPNTEEVKKLEGDLASVKQEEERCLKAYTSGISSFEAFESLSKELKSRRESLEKRSLELKEQEGKSKEIRLSLDEICARAQKVIGNLHFKEKRTIIEAILDRVVVNQESAIIKGLIPLVEGGYQNVKLWPSSRNCGASQCG